MTLTCRVRIFFTGIEELRQVYGDVERLDLMIGLYAEPKPQGFGFSDTAFRVFILMAARRLESDRFFTRDFRPEIYTQAGFDWVNSNTMRTVLLRHFPSLEPVCSARYQESVRSVGGGRREYQVR
jgi:Animal haem peroxidase